MSPGPTRRVKAHVVYALVVRCRLVTNATGDVWTGRKAMDVDLTCGHQLLRRAHRRFLVGERMRCKWCEMFEKGRQMDILQEVTTA